MLRRRQEKEREGESGGYFPRWTRTLKAGREGLRVLEDTARFVWNDRSLFESLREARHGLDRATRAAYPNLVNGRGGRGGHGPPHGRGKIP